MLTNFLSSQMWVSSTIIPRTIRTSMIHSAKRLDSTSTNVSSFFEPNATFPIQERKSNCSTKHKHCFSQDRLTHDTAFTFVKLDLNIAEQQEEEEDSALWQKNEPKNSLVLQSMAMRK